MINFFKDTVLELIKDIPEISLASYPEEWYTEDVSVFDQRLERPKNHHVSMVFSRRLGFGDNDMNEVNEVTMDDKEW